MKCRNCGLPLSPTNTNLNCPRCHTSLASGPKAAVTNSSPQHNNQAWGEAGETQRDGRALSSSSPEQKTSVQPNQFSFPQVTHTPFPQPGQLWPANPTPPSLPYLKERRPTPIETHDDGVDTRKAVTPPAGQAMSFSGPKPVARSKRPGTSNLGFAAAGLCVFTGGLLLIFVYFMALGLPLAGTANLQTSSSASAKNALPSPTAVTPSPTIVPSPTTGAFPGQQYIDNPQMATMVNQTTAQPIQTATTFKVNQRIYVTFDIHPQGRNGAVCLFWYLNSRVVTRYPFAVTPNANAGYSYAVYGGTGQAYIEIYWASSTACTDKMLAQRVNFTITR